MSSAEIREAYFETGQQVLADLGYGGLKLAEICRRLGVTTGSFYHHFENWSAYRLELTRHWFVEATRRRVEKLRTEPDPRKRIDAAITVGLALPHGADGAIRTWSSIDPEVHAAQAEIDRQRFDLLRDSALEILHDERQAQLFANWAIYLLVGYEQSALPPDSDGLLWIVGQLLESLDAGRFSSVPPLAC